MADVKALVEELRGKLAKATPGEWWMDDPDSGDKEFAIGVGDGSYEGSTLTVDYDDVDGDLAVANADLAVSACTNLPALLDHIESLEADKERLTKALGLPMCWLAMVEAGNELDGGEPFTGKEVCLNYSGNGAGCFVTLDDFRKIRDALKENQ